MTHKTFEVVNYSVTLKSRMGIDYIRCISAEVDRPDITYNYLDIHFMSDIDSAPPNKGKIEGDYISGHLYVPAERYVWYLDLLRNEKPIYADIDSEHPNNMNGIRTGLEPVGEGELDIDD